MEKQVTGPGEQQRRARYRFRIPGFIREDQEVGLGDIIKRATSVAGITPCSPCIHRAEAMNRWIAFVPRRRGGD